MIRFEAPRYLLLAIAVWIPWRIVIWFRRGGDTAREILVAGLFIWSLVVMYFTLFPMTIIFYAWHGSFNLVPFASIFQLISQTSTGLASYNIGGNLLLLAPLGVLLPLLFKPLQRPYPLLWRVAVISTSIEATQLFTRARAVDIDDVILNTTGVALAYLLYKALVRLTDWTQRDRLLLVRLAAEPSREPLLQPAFPLVVTATIAAALMLSAITGATLGDGAGGIVAYALANSPASTVVERVDVEDHAFVMVRSPDPDGEQLSLYGYKKVLPGRYTWVMGPASARFVGSGYNSGITAFNPTAGEVATIYLWGVNRAAASTVKVTGPNADLQLPLPDQPYFVVGFPYEPDLSSAVLPTFGYVFSDAAGRDLTGDFASPDQ